MSPCPSCGAPLEAGAAFCTNCGARAAMGGPPHPQPGPPPPAPQAAAFAQQPPPAQGPPPPPRSKLPWAWIGAGAAAALLAGVVSWLIVSQLNKPDERDPDRGARIADPSPTATSTRDDQERGGQDTPTPEPTSEASPDPTNEPTAEPSSGTGPATVLRRHYTLIDDGEYAEAYALFTPAYQAKQSERGWVAQREAEKASFSQIDIGTADVDKADGRATVPVEFTAANTKGPDRCERTFTGTATMLKIGGRWRYDAPGDYTKSENC